jgi:malate dehydrogenase (oxaloacetate-decarboxylating)
MRRPGGNDLAKNVCLEQLHDRNEVLYHKLLTEHLKELLPIVYDPTVGAAIKRYSHGYRRPHGVYLSVNDPQDIRPAFEALDLGQDDVDLVVATDAEQTIPALNHGELHRTSPARTARDA